MKKNLDEIRKMAQAALERDRSMSPLDAVKDFLQTFFFDADSLEEVRRVLTALAAQNDRLVVRGLSGLERLLADPPSDGTLSRLVAFDANRSLDDPSDNGATEWLQKVAEMVRGVLAQRRESLK
jgi:hypothetical protein